MAVNLSPLGGAAQQFFDDNGDPLSGGKVFTYDAGTTTPRATFTSISGATPHTNPIILDAAGRVPGGEIWLTDVIQYKFVVQTAQNTLVGTYDNIIGIDSTTSASAIPFVGFKSQNGFVSDLADADGSDWVGFTSAGVTAVPRSVQDKLRDVVSVTDFGVTGDGVADDRAKIQAAYDATPDGGTLLFPKKQRFLIGAKLLFDRPVNIDFGGSSLILNNSVFPNNRNFEMTSQLATSIPWTQTIGQHVNTFNATTDFVVGDYVMLSLGRDPYDANEEHYVRICRVIAVSGTTFSVDVYTPYAINGTSHYVQKVTKLVSGIFVRNLVIEYTDGTTADTHIYAWRICNVLFENISSPRARILFNISDSYNISVRNLDGTVVRSGISSHGRIIGAWQIENTVFENVSSTSIDNNSIIFLESWCRGVRLKNVQLYSSNPSQVSAMIYVSSGAQDVEFDGLVTASAVNVDIVNTGGIIGEYTLKQLRMLNPPANLDLSRVESFADVQNSVDYMKPGQYVENRVAGSITTSTAAYIPFAAGILRRLWVYVQSTTDLTAFVANSSGGAYAIGPALVAGQWVEITAAPQYGTLHTNTAAAAVKTLQFFPGAGFPATQRFGIVAEYWPIDKTASTFGTA